jgi:hypothetical protein
VVRRYEPKRNDEENKVSTDADEEQEMDEQSAQAQGAGARSAADRMPVPAKGKAPITQHTEELPVVDRTGSVEVDEFDDWDEEEDLERTRRFDAASRAKARRVTVALALVAALGLGFFGGVVYQKHTGSSSSSAAGAGSGFAALRAAFAGRSGAGSSTGSGGTGGFPGGGAGFAGFGGGNSVVGTVSAVAGGTLFVSQGSSSALVKVVTGPSSTVKVSAQGSVNDIQPGDTVIITGAKQSNGTYMAANITDSGASSTTTPAG